MKLIRHLSLFIILISAASEGFAQTNIRNLDPTTEELNQSLREAHTQIIESKERSSKNFTNWVLKFYDREMSVLMDRKSEEIVEQISEKEKQLSGTEEQKKIMLNEELEKLALRAEVDAMSELRSWFRRDFPNTPWGRIPQR